MDIFERMSMDGWNQTDGCRWMDGTKQTDVDGWMEPNKRMVMDVERNDNGH
jgi:hypothetical protein